MSASTFEKERDPDYNCEECGGPLRTGSVDSGQDACLYCRLPDVLDQQRHVIVRDIIGTYVSEDRLNFAIVTARLDAENGPTVMVARREFVSDTWPPLKVLDKER